MEALHLQIPTYLHQFTETMVCEDSTDNCYFNKCDRCKDGALFKQKDPVETTEAGMECSSDEDDKASDKKELTWYQWEDTSNSLGYNSVVSELYESFISVLP